MFAETREPRSTNYMAGPCMLVENFIFDFAQMLSFFFTVGWSQIVFL